MSLEHRHHLLRLADGRTLGYAAYGSPQGTAVLHFHAAGSSRLEHPVAHAASALPAWCSTVQVMACRRFSRGAHYWIGLLM